MSDILAELVRHNTWVNLGLIEACRGLTPQQLSVSVPGTYGSIADTFVHMVAAEEWALRQLTGVEIENPLQERTFPGFAELGTHASDVGEALAQAALRENQDHLIPVSGRQTPVSIVFAEVVSHGFEHKAQIMTTMTHLGVEPPYLGAFIYGEATGKIRTVP
jgi:uncharacterized damage-inducible protein DinB